MAYKKIEGEKVYLSPLELSSLVKITKWVNDKDSACFIGNYFCNISEELEKEVINKKCLDSSNYKFQIHLKDNDEFIGVCDLHNVSFKDQYAEIGYNIGEISFRNKGYGSEALNLLCDYAFNILNIRNIVMTIYDFNIASIKCAIKNNFKKVGIVKERYYCMGKYNDMIYYQLTKEEFYSKFNSIYKEKSKEN